MESNRENLGECFCNNSSEQDRLVRITDMMQKVNDYAASVKEVVTKPGNSGKHDSGAGNC